MIEQVNDVKQQAVQKLPTQSENDNSNVRFELGRAWIPRADALKLRPGAVISLDSPPGGSVDLYVDGSLTAKGEAVVIGGNFAVRIAQVVDRS